MDEPFALKIGADDFVRKPFSQRALLERVKIILRRAALKDSHKDSFNAKGLSTKVLEQSQLLIDPERHACTWMGRPVTLTVTEFLILQVLATRPGVVQES